MKKNKILFLFIISYLIIFYKCDTTNSFKTTTFSGKVILEGTNDFSGIEVMLFKPLEIDTTLININKNYPGVGMEVNQRTEFYWREYNPVYKKITDINGRWKIDDVETGRYHIVYKKEGYGWRVQYNVENDVKEIKLKRAMQLNGNYSESILIPEGSFVEVVGNVMFEEGANLKVEPGCIIEFKNDAKLELYDKIEINGDYEREIFIVQGDTSSNNVINIFNTYGMIITYTYFFYLKNGIYFKNINNSIIKNSVFRKQRVALKFFNCNKMLINNNYINNMYNGIISENSQIKFEKNILYYCKNNGIQTGSANKSKFKNNIIFNANNYGFAINYIGYDYLNTELYVDSNNFISNKKHFFIGTNTSYIRCNYNNFLNVLEYYIYCDRGNEIKLDFRKNYWTIIDSLEIESKIIDGKDYDLYIKRPIVDISNFLYKKVNWIIGN